MKATLPSSNVDQTFDFFTYGCYGLAEETDATTKTQLGLWVDIYTYSGNAPPSQTYTLSFALNGGDIL